MKRRAIAALLLAVSGCEAPSRPAESDNAAAEPGTHWHVEMDSLYAERGYRWHEAMPGESVQFGLPESDDRAFRIDCHNGRIEIIGPAATEAEEGSPIAVNFPNSDRRSGMVALLGDGANFVVEMAPGDPLLARLLGGSRIVIEGPEVDLNVPTAGGVELMRTLIRNCR